MGSTQSVVCWMGCNSPHPVPRGSTQQGDLAENQVGVRQTAVNKILSEVGLGVSDLSTPAGRPADAPNSSLLSALSDGIFDQPGGGDSTHPAAVKPPQVHSSSYSPQPPTEPNSNGATRQSDHAAAMMGHSRD